MAERGPLQAAKRSIDVELTHDSVDVLLSRLDVLDEHPLFLHVDNAKDLDVPSLCSTAEQAFHELQYRQQEIAPSCSSFQRRAIGAGLDYVACTLNEARQNLDAGAIPALVAAQLADAAGALRTVRDLCGYNLHVSKLSGGELMARKQDHPPQL